MNAAQPAQTRRVCNQRWQADPASHPPLFGWLRSVPALCPAAVPRDAPAHRLRAAAPRLGRIFRIPYGPPDGGEFSTHSLVPVLLAKLLGKLGSYSIGYDVTTTSTRVLLVLVIPLPPTTIPYHNPLPQSPTTIPYHNPLPLN
eukprot:648199-Rhodomonas_salina.1